MSETKIETILQTRGVRIKAQVEHVEIEILQSTASEVLDDLYASAALYFNLGGVAYDSFEYPPNCYCPECS